MNLTLDTSHYLIQPSARKSTQAGAAANSGRSSQQQVLPVSPAFEVPVELEYRARQTRQHYFTNSQISSRAHHAIRSYSSVTELEERTRVSTLFGLDEYA